MALLSRALKNRCQFSRETILSCSQCCVQSRTFVPPTGREYGLEKKWAYYNQPAIDTYAAKALTKVTPHQMLYAGKSEDGSHLIKSAQYLHKELPKRVARRVKDLQSLPYVVAINPIMQEVYELYLRAFYKLYSYKKIENVDDELQYSNLVKQLLDDHKDIVTSLAKAIQQVKTQVRFEEMSNMIERILTSRLGIRILAEHHIALRNEKENFIGIICTQMPVRNLIEKCAFYCREMCQHNYGFAPSVAVNGHTKAVFPYLPPPLEYMIQELLKNAMKNCCFKDYSIDNDIILRVPEQKLPYDLRAIEYTVQTFFTGGNESFDQDPSKLLATVLHHRDKVKAWYEIPPVKVTICNNDSHFVLKFSDRGGGIHDSKMERIFDYAFTTAPEDDQQSAEEEGAFDNLVKAAHVAAVGGAMSGYGFGLPTTKAYASFLGGSLEIVSLYGLGTDVYLKLCHINGPRDSFRI